MNQIKKVVLGPLTKDETETALEGTDFAGIVPAKEKPGVIFVFPDKSARRINLADFPKDVVTRLAVHGASQKHGDAFAGAADEADPLAYAKDSVASVFEELAKGVWRAVSAAGGPRATLLARALARVTGRTVEDAIGVVDNLTDEQRKQVRAQPAIKAATAAIKLEDQAAQRAKLEAAAKAGGDAGDLAKLFTAEGIKA